MANHEKSKKHKENLATLKLILQEETRETQSLNDSDGSCSVDDSIAKCDRLSDTVDGHGDIRNNKHANREPSVTLGSTTNDRLEVNTSVASTDKGDNDSITPEDDNDDILLLLTKNKTKRADKLTGYHEDHFESASIATTDKPQHNTTQDERYNNYYKIV